MMRTGYWPLLLVLTAPGALPGQDLQDVIRGNSFNPVGAGARAMGMGGTFIAIADDGTAASFNPAGLAQLRRTEVSIVGFATRGRSSALGADPIGLGLRGSTVQSKGIDFLGVAVPFAIRDHNVTLEVSYQRTIDMYGNGEAILRVPIQNVQPLTGVLFDYRGEQSGAFRSVSFATGYQLTDSLAVGASINYWTANWTARGTAAITMYSDFPLLPPSFLWDRVSYIQDQRMRGLNWTAGFLLNAPRLKIGGVYRAAFRGSYHLHEIDTGVEVNFPQDDPLNYYYSPVNLDVPVTSHLQWPGSAGLGVAFHPMSGITIAGDITKTHWSEATIERVPNSALLAWERTLGGSLDPANSTTFVDRNFFDGFPASLTTTVDTTAWRAGAEYLIVLPNVVLPLRAGAYHDRSPVFDLTGRPGRLIKGVTFGSGLNFSQVVLDFAYDRRTSSEPVENLLFPAPPDLTTGIATQRITEQRIVASVIYRFRSEEDPIKRALRRLFMGG